MVKKSALAAVENKNPDVSGFATTSASTAGENKIPDVSSLVRRTDFDVKLKAISDRVPKNKSKHLLEENELKNLKTFDLNYFKGKHHFEDSGTLIYLVFQPIDKYFKRIIGVGNGGYVYFWKSRGLSYEKINSTLLVHYMLCYL